MKNNSFKDLVEKYSALQSDGIIITDFYIAFYNKEGQYHRENGPAIIRADNRAYYFLNGKNIRLDYNYQY